MKLKKKLKIKIFLLFQLIVSPPQLLLIDIYIQDFFFFFYFPSTRRMISFIFSSLH